MSTSTGRQPLCDILVRLGVETPGLVQKAPDWLKPILVDSIAYNNLSRRRAKAAENYQREKQKSGYLLLPVMVIVAILVFRAVNQSSLAGFPLVCAGLSAAVVIIFSVSWLIRFIQFLAVSYETDDFVEKWVEKVWVVPENGIRLASLDKKIGVCEIILGAQSDKGWVGTSREDLVEYILTACGDSALLLSDYYTTVEGSQLNAVAKRYLYQNPFLYALVFWYDPDGLLRFIDACYSQFNTNPSSFDSSWIEKAFVEHIEKAQGE